MVIWDSLRCLKEVYYSFFMNYNMGPNGEIARTGGEANAIAIKNNSRAASGKDNVYFVDTMVGMVIL